MASLALDRRYSGPAIVPERDGSIGIEQALAAVRRLIGAARIDLLAYNCEAEKVTAITSTFPHDAATATLALHRAIKAETGFLLKQSAPRWVHEADGLPGERLLIKLADRSTDSLFLLISLADKTAVSRARVMRLVPDLMVLIGYHVRLSLRVRETEELKEAAAEALDHGECGVVAVRADHSVIFANAAASRHLSEGSGLRLRRGALRPTDHAKAIRFEAALDSVVEASGTDRAKRARASVMLLDSKDDARATIVVITPANGMHGANDPARGAAAIVYILQPSPGSARGLDTLCQLHGLSRVEGRLIAHLIGGLTLTEAAMEMHVKIETARSYLKQIFAKTGMHRQTDVVALMTRYLRAIRGDFDFCPA